jgi:hypothetical protein
MALLGNGWDDPQSSAIMALSGGLLQGNFGAGLLGANDAYRQHKADAMKKQLIEAQIAETLAQADQRKTDAQLKKDAQARQDRILNGDPSTAVSPGAFAPAADGFGPTMPISQAPQAGGLVGQARAMGIPENAIQADIAFNGGKGISDMLFKRGVPDMQVTNGYAYDKNRTGPGYLPQLNTSQDGKTSMVQIGPDGMPVVSAPTGAYNTFAGYQNIQEGTKANFDPYQVTPKGESPQLTSRGAVMRRPDVQGQITQGEAGMRAQVAGPMGADPEAIKREIAQSVSDLTKKPLDPGSRSLLEAHVSDLSKQLAAISGPRASVGMPLQSDAEKEAQVQQAKADVMPTQQRQSGLDNSKFMLDTLDKALAHPGLDKATGLMSLNPLNKIPGSDAKNFNVLLDQLKGKTFLQAFDTLKGGGQITEVEGKKATDAIARLDTAQSTTEFKKALGDLRDVVLTGQARLTMGQSPTAPTAPTAAKAPTGAQPLPPNPSATSLRAGQTYTLPNGKDAVWDGFRFKVTQ